MIDKESVSYRKGFAKGIEIYTENLSKGYYADEDNQKLVSVFKHYADTGFKKGIRLNNGQIQYFYGMAAGIEYKYQQGGTPLTKKTDDSKFIQREQEHYYGETNTNIDDEIFG